MASKDIELPYTMDMYKEHLKAMMMNPMAMGQPPMQPTAGTSIVDKLRAAATALSGTAMAGSTLG